jgi:zinc and cadmium transporter
MTALGWIVVSGLLMSALALVGAITLVLPERIFDKLVLPLVALAAGALLGGALFHMIPTSVDAFGNDLAIYGWVAIGLFSFFLLEQYLQWHHCHRSVSAHRPLGYLILLADGVHNFVGGLAVGGAFVVEPSLGIVTWLVAAAHEIPQELGDYGILVHSGWDRRRALVYNVLSALTFLVGGLIAYGIARRVEVGYLVPFAAGNFAYIAVADLLPELGRAVSLRARLSHSTAFAAGLSALYLVALAA